MSSSEIIGRLTGDRATWFSQKLEEHELKQYSVVDKNLVYNGPIDKSLVVTLLFLYYEYLEPGAISGWFVSNRRIEDIPFESARGKIIRLSIHLDGIAKSLTIRAPAYLKLTCKQQGKSVASASFITFDEMRYIGAVYVSSVGRLSMFFENKIDAMSTLNALLVGRSSISFYGDLSVDGYKISDIENSKKSDVSDQVLLYNPDNTPATEGGSRGFSDSSEYDFELLGPISSGIARHPSPGGGSYVMGSSAHTHMPIYRNDAMRMSNTLYQPHSMNHMHNHGYTQTNNMFQHHFNDNISHSSHLSQPIGSMGMMPAFNAQYHQYNPYTQFNNMHQQQYMNLHHKGGRHGDLDFQQYDPSTTRHTGQSSKQSSSKKTSLKHSSKKQIEPRQKKQTKKQSLLAPIKEKLKQKRSLQKDEDYYKKRDREYFSSEGEPSDGESLGSDDDDEEEDDHPNDEDKNFVVDEDDVDEDYVDEDEYKPPKRKNPNEPPPKKRRTRSSDVESDGTDLEEIDENDVEDLNDEVEDMDSDEVEDDTDEVDPDDVGGAENIESE